MPKHEIIHKPGEPVSDEIRNIVDMYFDNKEIAKLERLGGRILISIAAPYKQKTEKALIVDEQFLSTLRDKRHDFNLLKGILDELSAQQLKLLCKLMKHPIKSGANSEQMKREIIRSLQAQDYWKSISSKKE